MDIIEWIFFDIGGVLIGDDYTENWRIENVLGISQKYIPELTRNDVYKALPLASAINDDLSKNLFTVLLKDPGLVREASEEIYKRYKLVDYFKNSPIKDNAHLVIEELSKKYKLGIIANQNVVIKQKLQDLLQFFTYSGVSDDHGLIKPDPKYFEAVFQLTGANPKLSIMIDDNIERSLVPAKKFGMTTVWFKNYERDDIPLNVVDYTITELKGLLKIF